MNDHCKSNIIIGLCLFLGLYTIGNALFDSRIQADIEARTYSVTGLAEREVVANKVVLPISFMVRSYNMEEAVKKIDKDTEMILQFLKDKGLSDKEIVASPPNVQFQSPNDILRADNAFMADNALLASSGGMARSEAMGKASEQPEQSEQAAESETVKEDNPLYLITRSVVVNSEQVELVTQITGLLGELMSKGITLSNQYSSSQARYSFTALEAIKGEMVEEAARNAYALAKYFADVTGAELGKIREASQGDFFVTSGSGLEQQKMKIRLESRVQYYLID